MIAKSVFDYSWIEEAIKDKPVLIIIEGVLVYFEEYEVKELINKLVNSFKKGKMLLEVSKPRWLK